MLRNTLISSVLIALFTSNPASANDETSELRKVIEQQQETLKELEKRLGATEKMIDVTASYVEQNNSSAISSFNPIGGYGELHYNNIDDNSAANKDKTQVDFHRFVLFVNHEFTNKLRFFSELELEHSIAADGESGEIELEQAFIEYDINEQFTSKAGLFLVPVGIINETHEPPAFYGVERNNVEKNILPATWWEAGVGLNYKPIGGLSFDAAITSGLYSPTEGSNAYLIRSGRQKVSNAKADNLAYTARVKYTAIPGLELAASLQYQEDITQGTVGVDQADATLITAHLIYSIKALSVRALYAGWNINGDEAKTLGRNEQNGWYVEPSYKLSEKVGVFARYSEYDNNAGNDDKTQYQQTNVGVNYYLHPNVVFKADWENNGGKADSNGFNLGIGYQF